MPSKIQLDENLWFLYICLQKSDLKAIDFNAVGLATGLKSPAARMRYTRLKRQIESGALNAGHGPGFPSTFPPPSASQNQRHSPELTSASIPKKRKRLQKPRETVASSKAKKKDPESDEKREIVVNAVQDGSKPANGSSSRAVDTAYETSEPKEEKVCKIKLEDHSGSDADFDSQSGDDGDSEDEIPLAKLRKRGAFFHPAAPSSSSSSMYGYAQPSAAGPFMPPYKTFATPQSFTYQPSGMADGKGMERQRFLPRGTNAFEFVSQNGRAGFGERGFRDISGRVSDRRQIYASPYAGWIDGRGHEDQMGVPGPGWGYYAKIQEQRLQNQRKEVERGFKDVGSAVPRKSV